MLSSRRSVLTAAAAIVAASAAPSIAKDGLDRQTLEEALAQTRTYVLPPSAVSVDAAYVESSSRFEISYIVDMDDGTEAESAFKVTLSDRFQAFALNDPDLIHNIAWLDLQSKLAAAGVDSPKDDRTMHCMVVQAPWRFGLNHGVVAPTLYGLPTG